MTLSKLSRFFSRFRREERASATVEFAIIIPILFWVYAGSYVFFDSFRQSAINLKAAYTIGDLISRETNFINADYIDSMYNMTKLLTGTNTPMAMRITVIRWDEEDDKYHLDWSKSRGDVFPLDESSLEEIEARLPVMPDDERVILVETWNTWKGVMETGMGERSLDNFVFTRPRFAPQVVYQE